jgi:hypothetical protein
MEDVMSSPNHARSLALLLALALSYGQTGHAADAQQPQKAEAQSQANQAVQPQVNKRAAEETARRQKELLGDAQSAITETERALRALYENRTREALDALALATGKLELILARSPRLALAPVRTDVVTHDLLAKPDTVKAAIKEVRERLGDGEVQQARRLMEGLASDIEFRTLNIPLQTYPAEIKAITPLIDSGKVEEAKIRLQTLLNTLVITTEVVPLPKLRAEEQIKAAQSLAEKKNRNKDENIRLTQHIQAAREQLQLGDLLGYGARKDYKPMYQEIDELETKSAGGKWGLGWFDKIRKQLSEWR